MGVQKNIYCRCWLVCFKQKTAYEMRISDLSSDVCSSDLMPEVSFHVDRSAERRQQLAQPALQVPAGAVRLAHARRIDVQQRSDPRDPRGHVVAAGPVLGEPVVAEIDEAEAGQGVRTHVATRGERRFMTASVA